MRAHSRAVGGCMRHVAKRSRSTTPYHPTPHRRHNLGHHPRARRPSAAGSRRPPPPAEPLRSALSPSLTPSFCAFPPLFAPFSRARMRRHVVCFFPLHTRSLAVFARTRRRRVVCSVSSSSLVRRLHAHMDAQQLLVRHARHGGREPAQLRREDAHPHEEQTDRTES